MPVLDLTQDLFASGGLRPGGSMGAGNPLRGWRMGAGRPGSWMGAANQGKRKNKI